MRSLSRGRFGILILLLIVVTACRQEVQQGPAAAKLPQPSSESSPILTPTPTPTTIPTTSPTSTATAPPTSTSTPEPTPTPTPTAVPAQISGDPRAGVLSSPVPSGNAPCGVVDTLDFPLNPPDAVSARGGGDFGIWRGRYQKFHAGEDWRLTGGDNFGTPVYSIGHGLVTYANPDGWGRDKGVVIIRHILLSGETFLSFYGHLDPPSVTLSPGLCVTRGEQIGNIGRPRTSPHLHFEIRTHLPYQTGGGYWEEDPTSAGWLPPSLTIWHYRMQSAPGVAWTSTINDQPFQSIGTSARGHLILQSAGRILEIDPVNGQQIGVAELSESGASISLNARGDTIFTANQLGEIRAYLLAESPDQEFALEPLWTRDVDLVGSPQIFPLANGDFVVSFWDQLVGVAAAGDLLWQYPQDFRPSAAVQSGDQLILAPSSRQNFLSIGSSEPVELPGLSAGTLHSANGQLLHFSAEGISRFDPQTLTTTSFIPLPGIRLDLANLISLSNGNILVAHMDRADRRLILLDSAGEMIWQRSIKELGQGKTAFVELSGQPYLLIQEGEDGLISLRIFEVNLAGGDLTLRFQGGTREALNQEINFQISPAGLLLLDIGDRHLVALDLSPTAKN